MADRLLVSVVTGTYNRHDLLLEAIANVRSQRYRPLEHVVVSDGLDEALSDAVDDNMGAYLRLADDTDIPDDLLVPIRFVELGFHSSSLLTSSISAAPFMVAQLLARGEYQITLADDERFLVPDAIEKLVALLEETDADFVYSKVEMWREGQGHRFVIGTDPPQSGQFTHWLSRRSALDRGGLFRTHIGAATDWDCAQRMMAAGCRWAFLPEVTASHRIDK